MTMQRNGSRTSAPSQAQTYADIDTASDLSVDAQNDIRWAILSFIYRDPLTLLYQNYIIGKHRLVFATEQYKQAFRILLQGLRLNICPAVIRAVSDRLHMTGFEAQSGKGASDADAQAAWTLWEQSRLDRHAGQVHDLALTGGDAYLIVWPDETGTPGFYPQGATDMTVRYDPERTTQVQCAAKLWWNVDRFRLNLYYPDRIEKYQGRQELSKTQTETYLAVRAAYNQSLAARLTFQLMPVSPEAFEPFQAEGEPWPLPNPYGAVPVFHFANSVGIGQFGFSELTDVIPLQDAINKTLADMIVASEFGAYQQRYAIGLEPDMDEHGNPMPLPMKAGIDRFLVVANADAKIGTLPANDLQPYLNSINELVANVARVTGIPLHHLLLTGGFPSGESLKTAESRLVSKVQDIQVSFGDVWEDALEFALAIAGTPNAKLRAVWQTAESRAELEHVQSVALKRTQLGISEHEAWRELGFSDDEIAQMDEEKASEQSTATDAFNTAFNRPGIPVPTGAPMVPAGTPGLPTQKPGVPDGT